MFVTVKIWDCHGNRLRAGPAVLKALTEAWTGTSLMERCGRIVIFPDENPGTSGVCSPDEHSNESRMTLCRSGSSGAVRVSSEGTRFLTMASCRFQMMRDICRLLSFLQHMRRECLDHRHLNQPIGDRRHVFVGTQINSRLNVRAAYNRFCWKLLMYSFRS